MEIRRESDAPELRCMDGVVSVISGLNIATGRRRSSIFDPYASDSSDSPSPLMKLLRSVDPNSASSPSFRTPVKMEEDVIVMDGIPVKKSSKGSAEPRTRPPLMSSSFFNSNYSGGRSAGKYVAGTENVKPQKSRLRRFWKTCGCGACQFNSDCQFAHGKEELHRPSRSSGKIKLEILESNNNLDRSASQSYGKNFPPISQSESSSSSSAGAMAFSTSPVQAKPLSGTAVPNAHLGSDWSPLDDGIEVTLPGTSTEVRTLSKEDVDAYIAKVLSGSTTRKRLPVFVEICPE